MARLKDGSTVGDSEILTEGSLESFLPDLTGPKGDPGIQGPVGPAGTYTAGSNITINNDVISATDTVFNNGPNDTRLGELEDNVGKISVGGTWYAPHIVTELPASPSPDKWYIILE